LRQALAGAPRAHYTLGVELFKEDKLDEAAAEMREFVRLEPTLIEVPSARVIVAKVHLRGQRWAQAATELRTVLAMAPRHVEAREAITLRPNGPVAYDLLGQALARQGQFPAARDAFVRALQVDAKHADARRHLAQIERILHQ